MGQKHVMLVTLLIVSLLILVGCQTKATIVNVVALEPLEVEAGINDLPARLPQEVTVVYSDGKEAKAAVVKWQVDCPSGKPYRDVTAWAEIANYDQPIPLPIIVHDPEAHSLGPDEVATPAAVLAKLQADPAVTEVFPSPNGTTIGYYRSADDESQLFLWNLANQKSYRVEGVRGPLYDHDWSSDGRYLTVVQSTDVMVCVSVVDVQTQSLRDELIAYMGAAWAPESNELFYATLGDVELIVAVGDGRAFDLMLYNADTREKTLLLAGVADSIYSIVGWDGPNTIVYNREYLNDQAAEHGLRLDISR